MGEGVCSKQESASPKVARCVSVSSRKKIPGGGGGGMESLKNLMWVWLISWPSRIHYI